MSEHNPNIPFPNPYNEVTPSGQEAPADFHLPFFSIDAGAAQTVVNGNANWGNPDVGNIKWASGDPPEDTIPEVSVAD